jgi:hypothetical protein
MRSISTGRKLGLGILTAGSLFLGASSVQAVNTAFAPSSGSSMIEGGGNDSFFFTPNSTISVNSLGFFDGGIPESVNVGIFQVSNSVLLGSSLVTVTGSNPNGFDYASVSPILLTAGTQYCIDSNSTYGFPEYVTAIGNVGTSADLTFSGYRYDYNPTLDIPAASGTTAVFGPDFQYSASAVVPEPSTLSLLAIGTLSLLSSRRRD